MQLLSIIYYIGMIYGVGASTFALIFYFKARQDGKVDATEHSFIDTVNFILSIGVALLVLIELFLIGWAWYSGYTEYFFSSLLWIRLFILLFLSLDVKFIQSSKMPSWVGPAIASGLWYGYFLIALLKPTTLSLASLFVISIVCLIVWLYIVRSLERWYLKKANW